jgi:hypothetical protein
MTIYTSKDKKSRWTDDYMNRIDLIRDHPKNKNIELIDEINEKLLDMKIENSKTVLIPKYIPILKIVPFPQTNSNSSQQSTSIPQPIPPKINVILKLTDKPNN